MSLILIILLRYTTLLECIRQIILLSVNRIVQLTTTTSVELKPIILQTLQSPGLVVFIRKIYKRTHDFLGNTFLF